MFARSQSSRKDAIECEDLSGSEDEFSFNGKLISQRTIAEKNRHRIC